MFSLADLKFSSPMELYSIKFTFDGIDLQYLINAEICSILSLISFHTIYSKVTFLLVLAVPIC